MVCGKAVLLSEVMLRGGGGFEPPCTDAEADTVAREAMAAKRAILFIDSPESAQARLPRA